MTEGEILWVGEVYKKAREQMPEHICLSRPKEEENGP